MDGQYEVNVQNVPEHRKLLGDAIREHRKRMGMTQEQLGELAGLNPKYIGEVERAVRTISVDNLARVASALEVRVAELVRRF